jgi:phage terminase large subunit
VEAQQSLTVTHITQLPAKLEPLWHPHRYKVLYGGRGGTKSWGIARALLEQGYESPLRILCARETQRSIRDSVHRLLADQIIELDLTKYYEVQQTEIRGSNGTLFTFAGLSSLTVDSIKSFEGADRCWVEEGQTVTKRSWSILIPTIRKTGSEIWVSFNPDLDTDDTYVRFIEQTPPDTVLIPVSYHDNPWLSRELKMEMEHLRRTDPAEFDNVWEGKCRAAAQGAIYTREMQALAESQRVTYLPPDPVLKTQTVWDLGFNDQTAIILVQSTARELRIIDYVEDNQRTLIDYCNELKTKGLNWGTDYIPWDGADERYKFTNPANSPQGILCAAGRAVQVVPKADVETGIKRARLIFPRCYFDKDKTTRLRECLKRYRRIVPATTDEPSTPAHDEFSHGADAFRYLALVADSLTNDQFRKIKYPEQRHYA